MPNISSLTMPDGIVYSIKDSQARKDIEDIKKNGSAGSGGSGGGTFIATVTKNGSDITSDKSESEILDAFNSGKTVFASVPQYELLIPLTSPNAAHFEMSSIQAPAMESISDVIYIVVEIAEDKTCKLLTKTVSFDNA